MKTDVFSPHLRKVCTVGMATLMLSTLAHAADPSVSAVTSNTLPVPLPIPISNVPTVPEANAGLVLIPIVVAALFFFTRRLWPAKAAPGTESQKGSQ
jgi:hypothetical protein